MQIYNIHTHTFTMNNAPENFLDLYLPKSVASAINKITNTKPGAWTMQKILSLVGEGGKKYASFLKIGKSRNQMEVFEHLLRQYPNEKMKFIALSMYMEKCGAGNSISGFEGQLEELLEVKRRYPDRLLIFMGIDPRWKENGRELQKTVEAYFDKKLRINANREVYPFAGLKIYPSTGFYPFDENLKETFEWAAENRVPVLSHCYYKGGLYNNSENYIRERINAYNPYTKQYYTAPKYIDEKSWKWILGLKTAKNNRKSCSYFLEPEAYKDLYQHFNEPGKELKLCLAHFGGIEEMKRTQTPMEKEHMYESANEPYGVANKNWFIQVKELLTAYKGAYTDIAYTVCDTDVHPTIFKELDSPQYGSRIMFGTDFYMTEQDKAEQKIYADFYRQANERRNPQTGISSWEEIAGLNPIGFLASKYYDPAENA